MKDDVRSLYCLKKNIIENARESDAADKEKNDEEEIGLMEKPTYDSLLFYKPLSDDNFRMINQQGLFTVSRSYDTVEQWVSNNYETIRSFLEDRFGQEENGSKKKKIELELDSKWILLKINIETDDKARKQILKRLNRMNINYATLFPDIEGASLYANMQGDIHHY